MGGSNIYTGTLDVVILQALTGGPMHGYAIGVWLRHRSGDVLDVKEGVLYPALHRLLRRGWVHARWGQTDTSRRAKFYELTAEGRRYLAEEAQKLAEHSKAVLALLGSPAG